MQSMVPEMIASVEVMLERWKEFEGKELDVFKDFGLLTTEVISRTAFGSSYLEGQHIFKMVSNLTAITVKNVYNVRFPGIRYDDVTLVAALKDRHLLEVVWVGILKSFLISLILQHVNENQ